MKDKNETQASKVLAFIINMGGSVNSAQLISWGVASEPANLHADRTARKLRAMINLDKFGINQSLRGRLMTDEEAARFGHKKKLEIFYLENNQQTERLFNESSDQTKTEERKSEAAGSDSAENVKENADSGVNSADTEQLFPKQTENSGLAETATAQ